MYSQGSFNPQSGQGPQAPRPPPYLQHPFAPPVLSHNFQQGPLLPSPQVQPQLHQPVRPIYQHDPMALRSGPRQVPPSGMPNSGQPYLPPPPPPPTTTTTTTHRSTPLPHMYTTAQQKLQNSSYIASGPLPPPPSSHIPPKSLPPIPSQGSLHKPPSYQQPGGVQGLHRIPPPPPPHPSSNFPPSTQYFSSLEPAVGNSQISSTAPPIPLLLPQKPPPPPPPASSSPQPVLPCSPPPISSSTPISMPLPTGSLFQEGASGSKVDTLGEDGLSSQSTRTSANPPPKPKEEKIIGKIEELCQLIAKNGPSYEGFARQKESKNPEFNFLFGGEPGSESAVAHDYFLWMKTQCNVACKVNGLGPITTTNNLTITTYPDAAVDCDMEMEDDITGSEIDQAVSHLIEDQHQATGSISIRFEAKEQLQMLSKSIRVDASDEKLCSGPSGSSRLDEQGLKLVSGLDDETFGRSGFGVKCPVTISAEVAEFPFASYKDDSSTPIIGAISLRREEAAVADSMHSDKYSGEAMKDSSPFRLLQDYASDDNSQNDKDTLEDASPDRVLELVSGGGDKLDRDTGINLKVDSGSNSPYKTVKGIELLSESGLSSIGPKFSLGSQKKAKDTTPTSVASGSSSEHIEIMHKNHSSHGHVASPKAIPKEDVAASPCGSVAFSSKDEKHNEDKRSKLLSNAQKIDKFGRLVREGASDSDSDDSRHARRRRKRGRSRSRSQSRSRSPLDRRRRRRWSPRRRREKRSRSHSWSPKNRRSRSRSPSIRHASGFNSSNNIRWDRGQIPECFDFLRGKCYRGASCRFRHHGSEKSEGSRHHKSKQQHAHTPSFKNHNSHNDFNKFSTKASYLQQETINQEVQQNHNISVIHATKDDINTHNREDSASITFVDSKDPREVEAEVPKFVVQEQPQAMDSDQVPADRFPAKLAHEFSILPSHGEASKEVLSSSKNSIEQSQIDVSDPILLNADNAVQETDDSSISDASPNQTSKTSPKKLCVGETLPNVDSMCNTSQLPPFITSGPNVETNNAPQMQIPRDYNLIPQTATNQSQSASLESFPSYMLLSKSSLFSVTSSVSLPPPPPLPLPLPLPPQIPTLNMGTTPTGVALQFQQSGLPPRSDFGSQMLRPYSTSHSQVGEFQHRSYPPVHEPHQSLLHVEDYRLKPISGSSTSDSKFGVAGLLGEDSIKRLPVQVLSTSNAFAHSSNYPQPMSLQKSPATKMQSFSGDNVPSGEILKSSQIHPYLQQQQLPYDLHHSVNSSLYHVPSASSRYPADLHDRNQPLHLPDFGVTRSSTHFNPYASTFEKPLTSRFESNIFKPEKDLTYSNQHDYPSSLNHVSVDQRDNGSRQRISSPFSASGVGRVLPRPGDDQYDPLFDSIEPSNSYKKSDSVQNWEPPGNSDIVPRLKQSNRPLDMEENNEKKDFGGIALAASPDEEFGETANAEVGDVENGSLDTLANTDMGEMEIDQIKSQGKNKKSKESRSMKLFKVCLADFVKKVLKPSWRQGNMSKEAFKTVVKKTVDKVSGAMNSHQVPKSKPKITQYIDSSQRKLTKLVMGYVDKYAKG